MKRVLGAAIALAVSFSVVGCSKKASDKYPLGEFDIAYSGSACGTATSIGVLKGFFEEEGVKINLVSGNTFEADRAALAAGKIIMENGDFQYFPGVQSGLDVKLVGGLHEGCIKILVKNDSPIQSIADFRGKTVAIDEPGGTPQSVVSVAAGSVGINPQTEITWIPFPNDQIPTAIEKGEIDAVAIWDPFATELERTGNYRTILDLATDPLFKDKACCFLFASGKVVRENPAAVAATLRGYHKAVAYIGASPREAAELLVKEKKVATEDVDLLTELYESYNWGAHANHDADNVAKADAVFFAKELSKIGYLATDLDAQQFVDDMYVDIFALEKDAKQ